MSKQKFRGLAPKTSEMLFAEANREAQLVEPSGIPVQLACERCRKKRAKCDGRQPCFRCQKAGADCLYKKRQRGLITDLLAEIERLKKDNAEKDKLLQTLIFSRNVETCKTVIEKLQDGNKSRQEVLNAMASKHIKSDSFQVGNLGKQAAATKPADLDIGPETCSNCSCRVRPWNFFRCPSDLNRSAEAVATLSAPGLPTPVSLPSPPVNADVSQSQNDNWITLGLARTYVRQLFKALVTWDCLPFCIISEAPFLQAYDAGSTRLCSSALVNALLALAIRFFTETEDETGLPPPNCPGSKQAFENAERFLGKDRRPTHLPDIQALGILSIYELSCGRETEALKLAQLFFSSITDLCDQRSMSEEKDEQYILVRNTTYCGAVSLTRMLRLACAQLCNPSKLILVGDCICLDQASCSITSSPECCADLGSNVGIIAHSSRLSGIQLVGAKIFQLTEWVYKILSALEATPTDVTQSDVILVYTKCLNWYNNFFTLLKADGGNTPSVLFIHMYYQFCLLILFRPFIGIIPNGSLIRPSEICAQSAQSILSLAQSYENLFTLRRMSGFAPYFVLASGRFSSALEDRGSPMDATCVRISDDAALGPRLDLFGKEAIYGQDGSSRLSLSHLKVSPGGHARLLLDKMNSHLCSGDNSEENTGKPLAVSKF